MNVKMGWCLVLLLRLIVLCYLCIVCSRCFERLCSLLGEV